MNRNGLEVNFGNARALVFGFDSDLDRWNLCSTYCIYGVASLGRILYLWLAYERGILSQCFPFGTDFLGCLGSLKRAMLFVCARVSDGSTNNNE